MTTPIFFLFFLQLLTNLIESTYAFGLLQTNIPVEVVSVFLLLTPLILLVFRLQPGRRFLLVTGWLVLICRAGAGILDTRGKMMLSGLGVGAFLLFLPVLVWQISRTESRRSLALQASLGALLGTLASILLRLLYSANDITDYGWYRLITFVLAAAAAFWLPRQLGFIEKDTGPSGATPARPGFGRLLALCLASASGFLLLYFAFASPAVISRWTGASYQLVTGLAAFSAAWYLILRIISPRYSRLLSRPFLIIWNAIFTASLVLTILLNQVSFPAKPDAYPILETPASPLAALSLILMLLSYTVIFADLEVLAREAMGTRPSLHQVGGAFTLASLYLLVMILAQVFTTVYDYIPVVGPLFRDRFWLVFAVPAVVLFMPVIFPARPLQFDVDNHPARGRLLSGAVLLAVVIVLLARDVLAAKPGPVSGQNSLRILTYNIQQGYSGNGLKNFDGQLELIRKVQPDVIGLQETDTARAAGGNSDVVRYFSDRLGLYSYYGPKTVTGTFGVALLSRYPIENPRTFFMYSAGEQTAAIEADIRVGSHSFHVLVTHLGNGGPIIQQQQVLQILAGRENVIAVGDFNFRPDTDQYALTTSQLDDAWLLAGSSLTIPPGQDSSRRIDHIFVSPGTRVSQAVLLGPGPSDHPAAMADLAW